MFKENFRNMKFGKCAVCGKTGELTFEHIPPRAAFNSKPVKTVSGIEVLGNKEKMPWDLEGYRYKNNQKGNGYYNLCGSCNSYFGKWYVPSYIKFTNVLYNLIKEGKFDVNSKIQV